MIRITSEISIEDLVDAYPEAAAVLTRLGIVCFQCGAPVWGTLAESVERAGQNVDEVITELRQVIPEHPIVSGQTN